jgi:hypothetical protein
MKYILFKRIPYDYGAEHQTFTNGVLKRGIGAYENKDAKILFKLHGDLIEEISEADYDELKKKLNLPATSFRVFATQAQDPARNPDAVYADKESNQSASSDAEDLIEVSEAVVEDPLEGTE